MAFTDAEKVDIRRYCGYPVFGGQPVQAFGYRFMQWYGTLEFRMNNLATVEEETVRTSYLANLASLEQAVPASSDNLDTDQAAVWTHNKREVADRMALFNLWRRQLCEFFGVPPGPSLQGGGGSIELVV
ncbi:hypothetical protein J5T34_05940 [Cupriavidus gilardii]|uniref:hypothetical protein n=1 Tax=Cupriavidus gilardii TaxID=82541 RepID=UPI001ABE4958|nr:hypothetical protein [Cupriavidus gilardii]MBO4120280.1 hypothetical protein [Cupriavidus gilardii]